MELELVELVELELEVEDVLLELVELVELEDDEEVVAAAGI